MKGDTQGAQLQHRQVVGAVTNGNHLIQRQVHFLRNFLQQQRLARAIHNRIDHLTGECSAVKLQLVRMNHIHRQVVVFQVIGEVGKTAGEDRGFAPQCT